MDFLSFPSIGQFKNCISNIKHKCNDEIKLPKLTFQGTIKLHGTHADIVYNSETEQIYSQSRNRILTLDSDNCDFALYINKNINQIKLLFQPLIKHYPDQKIFVLHGEWCGGNIQKGVALQQLDKMFVVYNISVYKNKEKRTLYDYVNVTLIKNENIRIFNIYMFPIYNIEIDFENPKLVQNKLIELTNLVENECPVGKYFGVSGVGEGIVWTCSEKKYYSSEFWFKCKGEKHSVTKVKKLVPIDTEKLNNIKEFIDNTVTIQRLEQALNYLTEMNLENDKNNIGTFVNWVVNDILKEETDTIIQNNFDKNKILKDIKSKCYKWYINNFKV